MNPLARNWELSPPFLLACHSQNPFCPFQRDVVGVNQDVVQVNYYAHIQEIGEHVVYKALEGGWGIG